MSRNQLHGKRFEDVVKASGLFPGSADFGRPVDAGFDIEAQFDKVLGLPTSVKSSSASGVALADARRYWAHQQPFRLLIGSYRQNTDWKEFYAVHEIIVHGPMFDSLCGSVTLAEVTQFHDGFSLSRFPKGQHAAARFSATERLRELKPRLGLVTLNRKIDSFSQRRLQCSITLTKLVALASAAPSYQGPTGPTANYSLHEDRLGSVKLPVSIASSAREFG